MNLNGELNASDNLPDRVEGWLNVLDVPASGDISLLIDKSRHFEWRPMYCVLRISSHRLSHSRNEDRGLQKKAQNPSILLIEGTLDELLKSAEALNQPHKEDDLDGKERNLFSFGGGSSLEDNPTNKFINFINRTSSHIKGNLRRTRSSSKLDRRKADEASIDASNSSGTSTVLKRTRSFGRLSKRIQSKWRGIQDRNDSTIKDKSLRTAQSHESLVGHQPIINLTIFNSNTDVRVYHHSSVLSKDHCFLISSDKLSRLYSCSSSSQMNIWLKHLKRSLDPIRTKTFRNVKSLSVLISEAKNLSSKSRYFCELAVDGHVYGRTTTKAKGEMLFWGEEFHFRNMPTVEKGEKLAINIFQDIDKKKKKDLSILIGCISLQLADLVPGLAQEKWYPVRLVSDKSSSNKESGDVSIRIKVKYRSLDILPVKFYSPLLKHLEHNYLTIIGELEQLLSAKEKEEFSILMVNVFRTVQKSEKFLVDVVITEVKKQENVQTLLRSNSIASKSIDAFMKLVSEKYLKGVLGAFVAPLLDPNLNLEVDHVSNGNELQRRQERLLKFCNVACSHLFASSHSNDETGFPLELKKIFTNLKKRLSLEGHSDDTINQVISSCFFLRFICPAIMSPSLFGLARVLPQEKEARNCTLVAKAIQGLANFSRFGEGKEEAMIFLNEFVESQTPKLKKFIDEISSFSGTLNEDDYIDVEIGLDLARDLSLLHIFFRELLEKKQMKLSNISKELSPLLAEIDESLSEQKDSKKLEGSADSLDDEADEEGNLGRRRTMREIHDSGSYISFTSLQNISDQAFLGSGFNVSITGERLNSPEVEVFDKFSVSSRVSRPGDNDNSSSWLDARPGSILSDSRMAPKISNIHTLGTSKRVGELDRSLQNTMREMCNVPGPQRATLVCASETEIDCSDNSLSWKPLTPQGNLNNYSTGKLQITFNVPPQNDASVQQPYFSVSSLKRHKDQQPLIFSNPGFGLKSSLSQSSLKAEATPTARRQSPNPCKKLASLPLGSALINLKKEVFDNITSIDNDNRFVSQGNSLALNEFQENVSQTAKDVKFQASKSMEFAATRPAHTSNNSNFASPEARLCPCTADASVSFSGRGDIGFNMKSGIQNWSKVPTISKKIEGIKDQDGHLSTQKTSMADLKWMLQQEREARSRMESEYERRLRISEQERKKMEAKSFEDKKLIDALQRQVREEQERAAELEKKLYAGFNSFDSAQPQSTNKVTRKWHNPVPANVGAHLN